METSGSPRKPGDEVPAGDLCAGCGACAGLCPYIYAVKSPYLKIPDDYLRAFFTAEGRLAANGL